ncbi:transposase [Streptomyces malaysiensis]
MSLRPKSYQRIPARTVRTARAACPKGTPAMLVRDRLDVLFEDEVFASLYPADGRPGLSPGQLALVSVLQFAENLSDRQAADAVRTRIDWKYALGLELDDAGFDYSVLSEFRARLAEGDAADRLLTVMLERLVEAGLHDNHVAELLDQALYHVEHLRLGLSDTPADSARDMDDDVPAAL